MEKEKLVGLKKTSWHYRLVKFCWDIEPDKVFKNLCPYFWLAVASIVCFIPMLIYRGLKKAVQSIIYGIRTLVKSIDTTLLDSMLDSFDKFDLFYIMYGSEKARLDFDKDPELYKDIRYLDWNRPKRIEKLWNKLAKYDDIWEEVLNKAMKKRNLKEKDILSYRNSFHKEILRLREEEKIEKDLESKRRKINEEKERRAKERLYAVSNLSKKFFTAIGLIAILILGFFVQYPFMVLTVQTEVGDLIDILKFVIGVVGVVSIVLLFTYLGVKASSFLEDYRDSGKASLANLKLPAKIFANILIGLAMFFACVAKGLKMLYKYLIYYPIYKFLFLTVIIGICSGFKEGIIEFGGIFGDYFNASYSDYCPSINWEEEKENNKEK